MKDIKNLPKDKKIQLLEALREKKRRDVKKKDAYKPNEGQLKVHKSEKIDRFVFAGNGSGKSTLAVQEAHWKAMGYNPILKKYTPVPARIIVVLDLPGKIEDVFLKEYRRWFELKEDQLRKHGKPYVSEIVFPNGSYIKFMTHEQSPLAWESVELDFAIFDEPCSRAAWVGLKRGGRTKKRPAQYLLIGTPISAPWLRMEIYDRWKNDELPDTECFIYGSKVNESNLETGFLERFGALLSDKEKKVRLEGMFHDIDSLGLAHLFKRPTHIISSSYLEGIADTNQMPCVVALDPHPSKAHVATMVGADRDNNLYYIKEISAKLVARDFARTLIKWMKGWHVIDIVCDSLGQTDGTGGEGFKSFIQVLNEEMREHGYQVRPTSYKEKSDEDFIDRIRSSLKIPDVPNNFGLYIPKLRILENNPGIVRDIENVGWVKHKDIDLAKDKLDIRMHDHLACLKYALATNIYYNKNREKPIGPSKSLYGFGARKKSIGYNKDRNKALAWNQDTDEDD